MGRWGWPHPLDRADPAPGDPLGRPPVNVMRGWIAHTADAAARDEATLGAAAGVVQDTVGRVGVGELVSELNLFMPPNLPTKLEPSTTGSRILVSELIRYYLTNYTYTKIFGQRTGGLVRQYSVVLVVDASTSTAISPQHAEVAVIWAKALEALRVSVAIVTFSAAVTVVKPFSAPFSRTTSALLLAEVNGARPGSSLSDALSVAADMQTTGGCAGRRLVFALTDGASSASPGLQHCLAATCRVIGLCHSTFDPCRLAKAGLSEIAWALDSHHMPDAVRQLVDSPAPSTAAAPARVEAQTDGVGAAVDAIFATQTESNAFPMMCTHINELGEVAHQYAALFNTAAIDRSQYNNLRRVDINGQEMMVNPEGSHMDLAKDGAYEGITMLYLGGGNPEDDDYLARATANVVPLLNTKKMEVVQETDPRNAIGKIESGEYAMVWVDCTQNPVDAERAALVAALDRYWAQGGNICFWADNEPFVKELNEFFRVSTVFQGSGLSFSGNYFASKYLSAAEPGEFGQVPGFRTKARADLDAGLNTVFEGITICEPNLTPAQLADLGLSVFMYSSDSPPQPAAMYWEPPMGSSTKRGRLFIDTASTRLFCEWNPNQDGTARYVLNIAAWLVWDKRHGLVKKVEFK